MLVRKIFILLLSILLFNCAKKQIQNDTNFTMIGINGPPQLSVGETAIYNVVAYDEKQKVLKKSSSIDVEWEIEGEKNILVEKKEKNFVKIKAINKGIFCIKAKYQDHISFYTVKIF